jgi:predicted ATPase
MLTRLRFKNFKAWPDSGDIRLAPLTVLFGTNSAGKTSIPQLLLMLKQTAASPDRQRALQLGDSRSLVELGVYDDIVYRHEIARRLEIELEWTLAEPLAVHDRVSGAAYSGDRFAFRAAIHGDRRRQPVVESFRYELTAEAGPVLDVEMRRVGGGRSFELRSSRYELSRHAGRARPLPEPLRFYGFPDEVTASYRNAAFTADFVLALEKQLRSIYYVGPLRDYPSRLYVWSGEIPEHVGIKGEKAVEAILAGRDRAISLRRGERRKSLPELVAGRLRAMGLIRDFKVSPLGKHRKEYEVLVKTGAHMPDVKLTDVGFGVSQVLPVVVECFYVPPRSVVIFEQPEIHLHPRVQAELADLFIDAIRARERGGPRSCQFIIESHSEHFLRRLQRRIAEEHISADDTALYFVHTKQDHARLEALDLDRFGNIRNWPEGFFGDEMEDLVARTRAQSRRTPAAAGPKA